MPVSEHIYSIAFLLQRYFVTPTTQPSIIQFLLPAHALYVAEHAGDRADLRALQAAHRRRPPRHLRQREHQRQVAPRRQGLGGSNMPHLILAVNY